MLIDRREDMTAAEINLWDNQGQIDADGIMVVVSRQSLEETLNRLDTLRHSLKEISFLQEGGTITEAVLIARQALDR